ncbi:proclotting enzyme-like [Anthonomus grandis grandis]|uniref:proclotting enzyme-like n=1 Tax=Anthonomus grandis grandis TaxID=2921223 RepID=UPI0021653AF1|nr:proclotting enzyme-like [Anthonomus grandis grandis]
MAAVRHICLCLLVHLVVTYSVEDFESVVIDSADSLELQHNIKRDGKQILLEPATFSLLNYVSTIPQIQPLPQPYQANEFNIAAPGLCYNSRNELGSCVAFKECYPYFQSANVGNFDMWILGMYDTCSYYSPQGRQVLGICCSTASQPTQITNRPLVIEESSHQPEIQNNNEEAHQSAKIPNWPPPLPTHPPDHTIPPLPTHPPSPSYPGLLTTMRVSTTRHPLGFITTKPSTAKPTTKKPPSDVGSAACGAKNGFQDQGKIVGGHNADLNEWPWIAALFNNGRQFCGGSLIDSTHILSAAHCVAHMSSWDVARLTVRLGDHNIKTNSEVKHVEKRVKRVVRHKGFDSRTLYNDIAILTLDSPVEFNSVIRPVCLPSSGGRDWAGSTGTVIGWGSIRESGPQPSVLQEVNIPIWSNTECRQKYGHAAPGGIVEHMLCAGRANKDSCSGDSGGPLMVNNGRWTQVGIVSWGIGCGKGQYPGVYTRVEKFLPWIYKNLK